MKLIKQLIKEILLEKRAWSNLSDEDQQKFIAQKRKDMSPLNMKMFKQTYEKARQEGIYLQFSKSDLLAVKPMATHNYRGIYGWNIANFTFEEFVKVVPSFWLSRDFVILFKPKSPEKLLVASSYNRNHLNTDLMSILGLLDGEHYDFLQENMDEYLNTSNPYYALVDAIEATFTETGRQIKNYKTDAMLPVKGLNYATKYLIDLGYEGVLLTEEIVMFKTQSVDVVSIFDNVMKKK
jgi:predicted DNA binding CopG/RHH family protein